MNPERQISLSCTICLCICKVVCCFRVGHRYKYSNACRSTAVEVALKMAFKKFAVTHGLDFQSPAARSLQARPYEFQQPPFVFY